MRHDDIKPVMTPLASKQYGDLTVIKLIQTKPGWVFCRCKCGKLRTIKTVSLSLPSVTTCPHHNK